MKTVALHTVAGIVISHDLPENDEDREHLAMAGRVLWFGPEAAPDPDNQIGMGADDVAQMASWLLAWLAGNPTPASQGILLEFVQAVVQWRDGQLGAADFMQALKGAGVVRTVHRYEDHGGKIPGGAT